MNWLYGDAWERFPIRPGEVWTAGTGQVAVHNLFEPLPEFLLAADCLFIDPPWNLGNLNTFYTKAGRSDYQRDFGDFVSALFGQIARIAPRVCYLEVGRQAVEDFTHRLEALYPSIQAWPVTYYRRNPCWILRGAGAPLGHDFSGMDEADVIKAVAAIEDYRTIGDLCMGRGLVGLAAYDSGNRFVGSELNPRRLACLLDALAKRGAAVKRC